MSKKVAAMLKFAWWYGTCTASHV